MLADPPFNYLETLDKVDAAIDSNAELARVIVKTGLQSFHVGESAPGQELSMPRQWAGCAKYPDIDKARSTLRQFYRDWSAEGAAERQACYGPVMRALEAEETARRSQGSNTRLEPLKVLVPGAGLGRLVFELCRGGFEVEGNEISYHQLLASSYILNRCERVGQHTVYPWIHTFSNHQTRADHLRGYAIPDIHCATELVRAAQRNIKVGSMSMCAADFLCLYSDEAHADAYDAVASVFFLDTAPNLVRYLQTILYCLKPGGVLINIGPLLWHFENNAPGSNGQDDGDGDNDTSGIADPGSFELTDDEVMALVTKVGFQVESRETGLEAPYIQDARSMLQTIYKASSWVARKPRAASAVPS
jgi:carnosine N-methyltransferase